MDQQGNFEIPPIESEDNIQKLLDFFSKFATIAPIITVILIIVSLIYADGFYSYYGVKVVDFLSVGEIITLFISDIAKNIFRFLLLSLVFVGYFMLSSITRIKSKESLSKEKENKKKNILRPLKYILISIFRNFRSIYFFWIFALIVAIGVINKTMWFEIVIFYALILSVIAFYLFKDSTKENEQIEKGFFLVLKKMFVVAAFYFVFHAMGFYDAEKNYTAQINQTKKSIDLFLIDTVLDNKIRDLKTVYIGKIGASYFLFNCKDSTTIIIKEDQIKQVRYNSPVPKKGDFFSKMPRIIDTPFRNNFFTP